jgi:DNA polymerase-3 subunit gamma/tau
MNETSRTTPYRVLARTYRPSTFAELVGQDAMVRTLENAIRSGRLAHAFMLTGVRGVGKTTTARIIARALNCTGHDADGPTAQPCGTCEACQAIAEDRHVDVLEIDAASHTGVANIRELTDGVRYAPASARYKVYIIDEVHMLSSAAFNALLKTLEEPPPHVVFIFATTEVRKVPVTVLSRCQCFDLRRVEIAELVAHFGAIASQENVTLDEGALGLVARAAEGSVRDGLSLLDQAMALGGDSVDETLVREMLGLGDRSGLFDLYDQLLAGDVAAALGTLQEAYRGGADPLALLQDLLELTHWLTRLKLVPALAEDATTPEAERRRGAEMAAKLSMPTLARCWQLLLKGLGEVRLAPAPLAAAEMVLVRLGYLADMPSPAELVQQLRSGDAPPAAAPTAPPAAPSAGPPAPPPTATAPTATPTATPASNAAPAPGNFDEVVALVDAKREGILSSHLHNGVHLVAFAPGRIEIGLDDTVPRTLPADLARLLGDWTGEPWQVTASSDQGAPTLDQQQETQAEQRRAEAADDAVVQSVLEAFPGSRIRDVREVEDTP